jgi:hypothetical protein
MRLDDKLFSKQWTSAGNSGAGHKAALARVARVLLVS